MSASVGNNEGGQDFDLNLAPIIDCFTVLITFMLASASFLAIGVFDASVAANSSAANTAKPPSIHIDIELTTQKELSLRVDGKAHLQKKLPPRDGKYDGEKLAAELKGLKSRFPDTTGFVLSAADDVEYVDVIAMMEVLRKQVPSLAIQLGGL